MSNKSTNLCARVSESNPDLPLARFLPIIHRVRFSAGRKPLPGILAAAPVGQVDP
jgi:hypothetical protein